MTELLVNIGITLCPWDLFYILFLLLEFIEINSKTISPRTAPEYLEELCHILEKVRECLYGTILFCIFSDRI